MVSALFKLKKILCCIWLGLSVCYGFSQLGFSHEIGVIAGPVPFQSDYGLRYDFDTNKGNVGFGVALIHYLNFSYQSECDCYTTYTYFNDHFKIRNELSYTTVELNHFGEIADKDSPAGRFLRNDMSGKTTIYSIGTQLEYFPRSVRDFENGAFLISPYGSIGAKFGYYTPEVNVDYSNLIAEDPNTYLLDKYGPQHLSEESDTVLSLTASAGTRFKLSAVSDVVIEAKWEYFLSNWVDGVNPNEIDYPENRANDFLFFLGVGYVYYLDFQ